MSIKPMLSSIETTYRKVKMLDYIEWNKLCDGLESAYKSGAEIKIELDPAETPKITVVFRNEKAL